MPNDEEILKELKKISRIMTLTNGAALENEIAKYANTKERKIIWVLIDGKEKSDEIAKIVGQTKRSVDLFLDLLENAGLIDKRKYGIPPTRTIDYVPAEWIQLVPKQSEEAQSINNNKQTEVEQNG